MAFRSPDFTIVVGFNGSPCAEDALAFGELLAVAVLSVERGLLAVADEARAVAIVGGSSRRRRGRRTIAEQLLRRRAGAAVVVAPFGFRARAAGLLEPRVEAR